MITETYKGYTIAAAPVKKQIDKWGVRAVISRKDPDGCIQEKTFFADDNIFYILEIEAVRESINFGKNIIDNNLAGF